MLLTLNAQMLVKLNKPWESTEGRGAVEYFFSRYLVTSLVRASIISTSTTAGKNYFRLRAECRRDEIVVAVGSPSDHEITSGLKCIAKSLKLSGTTHRGRGTRQEPRT
jgi:hypothetical protein